MPRKILDKYNSFNRDILAEVLPESFLEKLDEIYNTAKILRALKKLIK